MRRVAEENVLGDGRVEGLSEKQCAVVRYTDAMTNEVKVSNEVFSELRKHFDDKEVVEITATVHIAESLREVKEIQE
jgi:alkylhydroperoxidase family enzyme